MDARNVIEATSLGDLLLRTASRYPDNDALVFPEQRVSYGELAQASTAVASALIDAGIGHGDHIGVLSLNSREVIEVLFGASMCGAVTVLLNARYRADEIRYAINNADIQLLFIDARQTDIETSLNNAFPALATQNHESPLCIAEAPLLRSVIQVGGNNALANSYHSFLRRANANGVDLVETRRSEIALRQTALMMYTSGTTARPKGCPLTHEAVVRNSGAMSDRLAITANDRMWDPLPMFHMAAILPMLSILHKGGAYITDRYFNVERAMDQLMDERISIMYPAFPAIMTDVLAHPRFDASALTNLRLVNNVAPEDTLKANMQALPQAVHISAYGMTEAAGISCHGSIDESDELRSRTCGRAYPGVQLRVVDPDSGQPCSPGQPGEMRIRGYSVLDGYYKLPEATAAAFDDDGWFRTGDICAIDERGLVSFHGRLKDMLKIGGENVSPLEIESWLMRHPDVVMAQVVAAPDPRLEQVVAAFIELKPESQTGEQDILDYCDGEIASFKIPRHIRFVQTWPMSATKIQKSSLREQIEAELGGSH